MGLELRIMKKTDKEAERLEKDQQGARHCKSPPKVRVLILRVG